MSEPAEGRRKITEGLGIVILVVATVVVAMLERAQILEFKCSYKIIPFFLQGLIDFVSFLWGSLEYLIGDTCLNIKRT